MLELQSNPKNIVHIEPYVNSIVDTYDINGEMYGNILISLTEAVNNAIVHGNKADDSKLVRIVAQRQSQQLAIRVSDEGDGFNYDDLPDPTAPENLMKLGGRGVFLMKQLSDDVNYLDNGSTVEIQFRI